MAELLKLETWDLFAKFASSLEFASSSPVWTDPQLCPEEAWGTLESPGTQGE
jgi:hypothetical protein